MHKILNGALVDMTPEEIAALLADQEAAQAESAAFVPPIVSPYQARVALLQANLLSTVEAFMNSGSAPAEAKIAWEYATQFERHSPFIESLGPLLNLTEQQIDDLFRTASQV